LDTVIPILDMAKGEMELETGLQDGQDGWTNGRMNFVWTLALTFYPLPQERK
jgi:hypothetical protein